MQVAIIAGSAECLWDDISKVKEVHSTYDVYCVNHTALYYPSDIKACISIHGEIFTEEFVKQVRAKGGQLVSSRDGGDIKYDPSPKPLDSGLLAARYVESLGMYDLIILCGIPLDQSRKFYEPYSASSNVWQDNIFKAWEQQGYLLRYTKSMSGKTQELLGGIYEFQS
jgi:hypothetical protein